jgi:hypothetical protein
MCHMCTRSLGDMLSCKGGMRVLEQGMKGRQMLRVPLLQQECNFRMCNGSLGGTLFCKAGRKKVLQQGGRWRQILMVPRLQECMCRICNHSPADTLSRKGDKKEAEQRGRISHMCIHSPEYRLLCKWDKEEVREQECRSHMCTRSLGHRSSCKGGKEALLCLTGRVVGMFRCTQAGYVGSCHSGIRTALSILVGIGGIQPAAILKGRGQGLAPGRGVGWTAPLGNLQEHCVCVT